MAHPPLPRLPSRLCHGNRLLSVSESHPSNHLEPTKGLARPTHPFFFIPRLFIPPKSNHRELYRNRPDFREVPFPTLPRGKRSAKKHARPTQPIKSLKSKKEETQRNVTLDVITRGNKKQKRVPNGGKKRNERPLPAKPHRVPRPHRHGGHPSGAHLPRLPLRRPARRGAGAGVRVLLAVRAVQLGASGAHGGGVSGPCAMHGSF